MKKISLLWCSLGALITARLLLPLITPPGFFLDEAATGAHVASMLHNWTNAHGTTWPLFSESLGGGYTTPVYLYPLTIWAAIFGASELSLRYFSVFATLAAIAVIAYVVRLWVGHRTGLITAVAGLALPWGWLQGSLAWDPALVPLFVAGALLFFSLSLLGKSRRTKIIALVGFPITLIALAYLYPPMRVTAPLLFAAAYALFLKKRTIGIRGLLITCLGATLLALPLAMFMFQPEALARSQALSVFHDASLLHGLWFALLNFLGLINPIFLFVTGDPNLRHSTGFEGMLGIAAVPPLLALLYVLLQTLRRQKPFIALNQKTRFLLLVSLYGTIACLLGSALTNEGQPHSLRATGAWMFLLITLSIGWMTILSGKVHTYLRIAAFSVAIVATVAYVTDFAFAYPERSATSFDVEPRQAIYDNLPTPGYPELARRYYLIR